MKRRGRAGTMQAVAAAPWKVLFSARSDFSTAATAAASSTAAAAAAATASRDQSFGVVLLFVAVVTLTGPTLVTADGLPHFTEEPQSAIVAHRQPVTLRCQVDPPSAQVAWLFNGEPLDAGSHRGLQVRGTHLHFPHFHHGWKEEGRVGNDGVYRCTATTPTGTIVSRPAVLSKPVLRRFAASDDIVITAYEGGYATLPCTPPYSVPPANILLLTPSGHMLNDAQGNVHRLPSGSTVMKDLRVHGSGNYTCVAVNRVSGLNRSATHRVILRVTPQSQGSTGQSTSIVDRSTATLQVTVGDSVTLECPVAGVGVPAVAWTRGYGQLPEGYTLLPFGSLRISSVALRDGGAYLCETPNGQKRQVLLEVQMAPQVTRSPRDGVVTARPGEDVKLTCRGGAFPAPSLTWFHNGVKCSTSGKSGGEVHTLHLQRVQKEDQGLYVCELSNPLGQASAVISLSVQQTPHPEEDRDTDGEEEMEEGLSGARQDIPSEDSAVNGRSTGAATPTNNDDNVDKGRNFRLEVANNNKNRHGRKKKKHGGKKKNRRRKNRKKGRTRKAKLVPPLAPTISRLSDTSVLVQWTVPENDGLPISLFRVQYKEVQPNNGQWQTVEDDIGAKSRRYKVTRLKAGGTYKFRMAAVYSNNDNRNSPNSRRFRLTANPYPETRPPTVNPRVVEAKPIIYKNILAIGIKWQYLPTDASSIDGFYIFYKPYGSKEDYKKETLRGASIRNHLLTSLEPDTEYSIKMKCFNSVGASDFSNMVVKRTLPLEGQSPSSLPPPRIPPQDTETEASPASRRETGGLDQPVILGIVLGIMLLLLVVFITMCWWKQRQQKRQSQNLESCTKFQDQAHRIYTDNLRKKKHPNGGGPYPLNGLNGLALANGHCPPPHDLARVNLDLNTLAPLDHHMHHRPHSPVQHDLYSGKPYHGNGMLPNGTVAGYGHGDHSDNNFNTISHTISSDNIPTTQGMVPNGISGMGSLPYRGRIRGDYNPHPYPQPSLSHASLSSFTRGSHHSHHGDSASQSDDDDDEEPDSPDEAEPLARENPRYARDVPPSYPYRQGQGHVYSSGDNVANGLCDPRSCYGYGGSYTSTSRLGSREEEEGPGGQQWFGGATFPSLSSSQAGKHKRRRKRPHGEHEHTMKDQATNTDLSSNEGTIEFLFNKSPASSVSASSDNSVSSDTCTHSPTLTPSDTHSVGMMATSLGPQTALPL